MKFFPALLLMATVLTPVWQNAGAADWRPEKPITLVVPFAAGGATDLTARILAQYAGEDRYFGQPMVVVNKTGAGGMVGTSWVWGQAPRDGYTMAVFNVPTIIVQPMVYKTNYNPDLFAHVAVWRSEPQVMCVPKSGPFASIEDMLAYNKAHPDRKITFSGGGLYGPQHLIYLQFAKAAGVNGEYIPTTGGAEGLKNIVSGSVQAGFLNASDAIRAMDRLRIVAIGASGRYELCPDVPTFAELGYPAVNDAVVSAAGVMYAKGVPENIVASTADIISRMLRDDRIVKKFKEMGCPPHVLNAEGAKVFFAERIAVYQELLGVSGWKN